jgi:hypothetical protein
MPRRLRWGPVAETGPGGSATRLSSFEISSVVLGGAGAIVMTAIWAWLFPNCDMLTNSRRSVAKSPLPRQRNKRALDPEAQTSSRPPFSRPEERPRHCIRSRVSTLAE